MRFRDLTRWMAVAGLSMFLAVTTVLAQEGGPGRRGGGKGRAPEFRQQFRRTMMSIRQKEQQLLQDNPELKKAVADIDKQIEELREQRQNKLAEADPELAKLYKQVNEMREKARQFRGGHGGRGGRKGRKGHGKRREKEGDED